MIRQIASYVLIVGLGNPGKDYQNTRHNIGFLIIDRFIKEQKKIKEHYKHKSLVVETKYNTDNLILLKPLTFMNNSGLAVASAYRYLSSHIKSILVIHDDIDIGFGKIKFKIGSGTGGHKGLESIVRHVGSLDFDRLRFGIGRPPEGKDASYYVLSEFTKDEIFEVNCGIEIAVDAIKDYILNGVEYCMNKYN